MKEVIGDAIRNAGMRFGMALDLWTSSDLEIIESGGARKASAASTEQDGQESREQAFARLTEQYRNCWGNALSLTQIRIEGKRLGLSKERVQGPPPESKWMTFDELIEGRITELKAAQGGDERSAA